MPDVRSWGVGLVLLGLLLLWGCAPKPTPTPVIPPVPPPSPERRPLVSVLDLARAQAGQTVPLGSYQVTPQRVRVTEGAVEVEWTVRRGSEADTAPTQTFNPLFLATRQEAGTGVRLLALERPHSDDITFLLLPPDGTGFCETDGREPAGWESSGRCRFALPQGAVPVYLVLVHWSRGGSALLPVPLSTVSGEVLVPLGSIPSTLVGRVPDAPAPPGVTLRTAHGLQATLVRSSVVRKPLPAHHPALVSIWTEPGTWLLVHLRVLCPRAEGCTVSTALETPDASIIPLLRGQQAGTLTREMFVEDVYWDPQNPLVFERMERASLFAPGNREQEWILAFRVPEGFTGAGQVRVGEVAGDSQTLPLPLFFRVDGGS
ncbi:MAG: hypothetical protein NZ951_05440 [Dehalococcoidia bacterium]|nr:hypothetical protein [Dehalococcoidia bacterium]MDW8120215.1 hypothetical protein [Chloroflexota bacterium]